LAWDNHVARRVWERGQNLRGWGDFRESGDIWLRASAENDCDAQSERGGETEVRERVAKETRRSIGGEKDEDARKKKKKKKKKKTQKAKPGEPESLEAIAKRLAEQEFRDDDDAFFGESTTSSDDENEDSDTESDVDEKELKREKEKHDKLLRLHVKNLHKAEKKTVKESVKTKVLRLFRRGPPGQ